jgi:hypothetical protein
MTEQMPVVKVAYVFFALANAKNTFKMDRTRPIA